MVWLWPWRSGDRSTGGSESREGVRREAEIEENDNVFEKIQRIMLIQDSERDRQRVLAQRGVSGEQDNSQTEGQTEPWLSAALQKESFWRGGLSYRFISHSFRPLIPSSTCLLQEAMMSGSSPSGDGQTETKKAQEGDPDCVSVGVCMCEWERRVYLSVIPFFISSTFWLTQWHSTA